MKKIFNYNLGKENYNKHSNWWWDQMVKGHDCELKWVPRPNILINSEMMLEFLYWTVNMILEETYTSQNQIMASNVNNIKRKRCLCK